MTNTAVQISSPAMTPLLSGLAGATTVTLVHETVRHLSHNAPRMDILGRRVMRRGIRALGITPPHGAALQGLAFVGDIVANSLYYSLAAIGGQRGSWLRGTLLGSAAGLAAVVLPPRMGLGRLPEARTTQTKIMTVAWYVLGGLAAAATTELIAKQKVRSDLSPLH